jgi:RNA polymerase sigma-70 factor (family 1)
LALQKGSSAAFKQIYHLYKDKLYNFSMKMLASDELSKEVVQETFIKLWEKRANIDAEKSLGAYLFTIAKNLVRDHQAHYSKKFEATSQLLENDRAPANDVMDKLAFLEIKKTEEMVVSHLSPQQREVYILSRYNHLSHQEIAENMGISINSVKTHLRLALKTLRAHIAPMTDFLLMIAFILTQY